VTLSQAAATPARRAQPAVKGIASGRRALAR
jgi:hypothetical protein